MLDRSQIYEVCSSDVAIFLSRELMCQYRDTDSDRPETAHAVIDLKFASVREGRGTDRRFGRHRRAARRALPGLSLIIQCLRS